MTSYIKLPIKRILFKTYTIIFPNVPSIIQNEKRQKKKKSGHPAKNDSTYLGKPYRHICVLLIMRNKNFAGFCRSLIYKVPHFYMVANISYEKSLRFLANATFFDTTMFRISTFNGSHFSLFGGRRDPFLYS